MKEIHFKTKSASWREISQLTRKNELIDGGVNSDSVDITTSTENSGNKITLSILLLYGSWNSALIDHATSTEKEEDVMKRHRENLADWFSNAVGAVPNCLSSDISSHGDHEVLSVKVDQDDDTMDICISDCSNISAYDHIDDDGDTIMGLTVEKDEDGNKKKVQLSNTIQAPANLPALIFITRNKYKFHIVHVNFDHVQLTHCLRCYCNDKRPSAYHKALQKEIQNNISSSIQTIRQSLSSQQQKSDSIVAPNTIQTQTNQISKLAINNNHQQIRVFIAGDKSQVGKSSICLGLIGTLLTKYNYHPSSLAYIKPATQCEESQLIAKYCNEHKIENRPIGPLVYYKGFTRAFLNGTTDDTDTLLQSIKQAVDSISLNKKIVIIDGVGYPAVGSICGTDNVSVALASRYNSQVVGAVIPPAVLIVGKRGVGDAIDSYNLCATYFKSRGVKVMGTIFNRLPNDSSHFYSLEKCKQAVTSYFKKVKLDRGTTLGNNHASLTHEEEEVFGFIPEMEGLSSDSLESAEQFIDIFSKHVNVSKILEHAIKMRDYGYRHTNGGGGGAISLSKRQSSETSSDGSNFGLHIQKKMKQSSIQQSNSKILPLTREEIENAARSEGAAGG